MRESKSAGSTPPAEGQSGVHTPRKTSKESTDVGFSIVS